MGGGFGGCVLALVPEAASGPVRGAVSEAYARHGWTAPEFLDAIPSDHARRLALPGDSGATRGLEPPPL
jgi:galactokinase